MFWPDVFHRKSSDSLGKRATMNTSNAFLRAFSKCGAREYLTKIKLTNWFLNGPAQSDITVAFMSWSLTLSLCLSGSASGVEGRSVVTVRFLVSVCCTRLKGVMTIWCYILACWRSVITEHIGMLLTYSFTHTFDVMLLYSCTASATGLHRVLSAGLRDFKADLCWHSYISKMSQGDFGYGSVSRPTYMDNPNRQPGYRDNPQPFGGGSSSGPSSTGNKSH